ncbi:MAG: Alkanesulfonates ABC transporter ATP-binding protein / Sulfonate ABC transporter, ATP-binding subunit SsuB [uncultured Paraburkholderia sp.]|nr:MAG: Alkanesulfonates ABC transporter ATP-binding protein / Sulfonate ABC transporter, ATP-binding subunit SsuB [uncultured Paraburkholderia sp.]CAH2939911.1 MAG: Alkanesulfonates ABC transporter ATP-binding protein / Sulfonate ABC transporter, ATP-binding subunit SsuB [uncultured Paraburkholderia sp.]
MLQNVMLGLPRSARDDARAVLAEVGLLERADDWSAQLSGGQRWRVRSCIGRNCCCSTSRSARSTH